MSAAAVTTKVEDALRLLHEPGDVFEIRMFDTPRSGTVSGYFNDVGAAAAAVTKWDGKVPGVYVTLNPTAPKLLALANNRLKEWAKYATKDEYILRRRWLLIDVDFHRPAGISATDDEVRAAGKVARRIREHLDGLGWPAGILTMSGNGAHLLYRIELPNDDESKALITRLLTKLATDFDEPDGAQVDTSVFNASRVVKVPGTMVCKGDEVGGRKHRRSKIVAMPEELVYVALEALEALAGPGPLLTPEEQSAGGNGHHEFDVEDWMRRYGLVVKTHDTESGGDLWKLEACPFDSDHEPGKAWVRRGSDGKLSAGCWHATCFSSWGELREKFEPGHGDRKVMRAWAAETVKLPAGAREAARQEKIAELKETCAAPGKLVDAYLVEVGGNGKDKDAPAGLALKDAEPWPEEVDGAELLDDLAAAFQRFVALPEAGAEALALWTLLTFTFDAFFILPMLAMLSAVKRSGKTTALAVLGAVAARPLPASNITASALFRAVDKHHPTLIIDEADSFLKENEEMRGILNAGHTRSNAFVIRNVPVGDGYEPVQFSVWCPKAVAGIGKLAATLEDRSIIVQARRRARGEKVERLRLDRLSELEHLRRKCRRWADDHVAELTIADPVVPDLSSDRAADNWRPLLAIAAAAGGEWPDRARWAAIVLGGCGDESDGASVMLLEDMRDLFAGRGVDRLTSAEVVQALSIMEERPWPEWKQGKYAQAKAISTRQVAKLLHGFGIKPKAIKFHDGNTHRGYQLDDFHDAFKRYVDPYPPDSSVTNVTSLQNGTFSSVTADIPVTDEKPAICREVTEVTDENPPGERKTPLIPSNLVQSRP